MTDRPVRTGIWLFPDAPAPRMVDAITQADGVGLDELWLGDEGPARDPIAVLAAAAVRTRRIRLAVGVTNPYLRHPALSASSMVTVHELSGGRAVLGLGAGGSLSLDPVGITPTTPLADCRRALDVMRAVLRRDTVDGYTPPAHAVSAPDLPLFIGARGERFNRWASAEADGVFVAGVAPMLAAEVVGWARSVRPVDVALYVSACLRPADLDAVRPRMIHAFANAPVSLRRTAGLDDDAVRDAADALRDGDDGPASRLLTDAVLDLVLAGPGSVVDTCVRLVRELRPASIGLALLGVDPLEQVEQAAGTLRRVVEEIG